MKNLKYIIAILVIMMGSSCKKNFLDSQPLDQYSDALVWKDSSLVVLFVNSIYQGLPSEYGSAQDMLDNYTDNGANKATSATFAPSLNFNQNLTISSTGPFASLWGNHYAKIRQCNLFLKNIGQLNATEGFKTRLTGEVRFLRALYYHFLYNYFGRFPLVTEVLSQDDNLFIPRATDQACIGFITDELTAAANILPVKYTGTNIGRVTKGAALALQSRVYLYSGQWQNASNAAAAVMALNTYSLFPDYAGIFYPQNDNNSEVIFDRQYLADINALTNNFFDSTNQNPGVTGVASSGYNNPTGNLVDSYEMRDGSNFNWSNPLHAANPYADRDPRMDATVIHDGSVWMSKKVDMKRGSVFNPSLQPSLTGYYIRKFLDPNFVPGTGTSGGQNFVILRYAEVLLNYAEAQLNMGNTEEARKYVNMVRARTSVAMPPIASADFNMASYRRERRIELAFEGTYLWDINRWKTGPTTRGVNITGVECTDLAGTRTYTPFTAQAAGVSRVWVDRMYLFPIPLSEIQKYPAATPLEQNPGW